MSDQIKNIIAKVPNLGIDLIGWTACTLLFLIPIEYIFKLFT